MMNHFFIAQTMIIDETKLWCLNFARRKKQMMNFLTHIIKELLVELKEFPNVIILRIGDETQVQRLQNRTFSDEIDSCKHNAIIYKI